MYIYHFPCTFLPLLKSQYQLSFNTSFKMEPVFLAGIKSGNVGNDMLDNSNVDCVDDVDAWRLWPDFGKG